VADTATRAFHHPDFTDGSNVQREMREFMKNWIDGHGPKKRDVIQRFACSSRPIISPLVGRILTTTPFDYRLTKGAVRNGDNTRLGSTEKLHHDHGVSRFLGLL
jgi:hypothetical protein